MEKQAEKHDIDPSDFLEHILKKIKTCLLFKYLEFNDSEALEFMNAYSIRSIEGMAGRLGMEAFSRCTTLSARLTMIGPTRCAMISTNLKRSTELLNEVATLTLITPIPTPNLTFRSYLSILE